MHSYVCGRQGGVPASCAVTSGRRRATVKTKAGEAPAVCKGTPLRWDTLLQRLCTLDPSDWGFAQCSQ